MQPSDLLQITSMI